MSLTDDIAFDRCKADALQRAHDNAVAKGQGVFVFEGREYVTRYAFYLLEYLNEQFGG